MRTVSIVSLVAMLAVVNSAHAGGGQRVVDATGRVVGTVLDHSHVLRKVSKGKFASLRVDPTGFARPFPSGPFFYFETADCSGPRYVLRGGVIPEVDAVQTRSAQTSTAFDGLYYASDPAVAKTILSAAADPPASGECDGITLPDSNFCCHQNPPVLPDCTTPPCTAVVGVAVKLDLPQFQPPFGVK